MSSCPRDGSWDPNFSERLVKGAAEFRVDNILVPWEELVSSDSLLVELGESLRKKGCWPCWPHSTPQEIRQELLRMHERWKKVEPRLRSESDINWFADRPTLWAEDTEDDDDVFMASRTAKRAAASKGKRAATSKSKSAPSRKSDDDDDAFMPSSTSKRAAPSKGKRAASSKSKSGPSTEAGGCVDGR